MSLAGKLDVKLSRLSTCLKSRGKPEMRALIVDGSEEGIPDSRAACEIIGEELKRKGWDIDLLHLIDQEEGTVPGCFRCWMDHPGICSRQDSGKKIPTNFVRGDLAILLLPVKGGGMFIGKRKGI
jgi:hypothetical protein